MLDPTMTEVGHSNKVTADPWIKMSSVEPKNLDKPLSCPVVTTPPRPTGGNRNAID
jgi:hypothetical protein